MPIPPEVLRAWRGATLTIRIHDAGESVVLPPAEQAERGPGHFLLWPSSWFVSAQDPLGAPQPPDENERLHAQLLVALRQSGLAILPARLEGPGLALDGFVLRGAGRARAMQMGYKRRQWAVLGIFRDRLEVVYTGVNSRMEGDT